MKKYYNSLEWGIQKKDTEDIRENGLKFLRQIQCSTLKNYTFQLKQIISEKSLLEKIMQEEEKVFVLFEPKNPSFPRFGEMNITEIEQIYSMLRKIPEELIEKYKLSIIQQIESVNNSFTGTAMSDGKGRIFMEFLKNTVNSRELTSSGVEVKNTERCFFSDFETVEELPETIPISVINMIKEKCQYFKGYYEFTYGKINGKKDLYFTFFSDIPKYINLLRNYPEFSKDAIHSRAKYLDYKEENER